VTAGERKDVHRLRAFLDTSAIAAILQRRGTAPRLLSEDVKHRVQFAVNPIVLQEILLLAEAQNNPEVLDALRRDWEIVPVDEAALALFLRDARELRNRWAHSNDLLIVSSASKCDYLVTYDEQLRRLVHSRPPRVVTPEELLDDLGRQR